VSCRVVSCRVSVSFPFLDPEIPVSSKTASVVARNLFALLPLLLPTRRKNPSKKKKQKVVLMMRACRNANGEPLGNKENQTFWNMPVVCRRVRVDAAAQRQKQKGLERKRKYRDYPPP